MRVLPITEEQVDYCKDLVSELRRNEVRGEMEFSHDKLQGRILRAEEAKVHTMLVVGARDMESGNGSVRLHGKDKQGAKPKDEFLTAIK